MMAGQMRLHRKGLMLLPQVTTNDKGVPGVMETLPAEVTTIDLLNCAIRTSWREFRYRTGMATNGRYLTAPGTAEATAGVPGKPRARGRVWTYRRRRRRSC